MHTPTFQVFGSASSQDLDVVFFVGQLGTVQSSSELAKQYASMLSTVYPTSKTINANLATVGSKGHLTAVYKGTTDELNNALMATYHEHFQQYPLQITTSLPRDIELKVLRCARVILSFLSRTSIRTKVKSALRNDLLEKLAVLTQINLSGFQELGKHGGTIEFHKTTAFQLGQTLALAAHKELYTKEAIANYYRELTPYLFREGRTADQLQVYLQQFIKLAYQLAPQMKSLYEYPYEI